MAKRVLIATVGSFGDLHPYLAIAIGLKHRGHAVTLASSEMYREKVEGEGIRFVAIPPDLADIEHDAEKRRRAMHALDGTRYVVQELFLPPLQEQYEILLEEGEAADVMLGSTFALGLPLAAAKLGKPYLTTALQPAAVLSEYDPPAAPMMPFLPKLPRSVVKWVFRGLRQANRFLLKEAYELARREGLPAEAVPALFRQESPHGNLILFSKYFMPVQLDFPRPLTMCGFPFYDKLDARNVKLDEDLEAFLDAGEAPVVFTLGTSAVLDPGLFYEEAAKAVKAMGKRAVFLVGRANYESYRTALGSDDIHVVAYAPHSLLMPRAAVNVHQGGIGTTAQALRAGRPMVVVPFSHDQPDNARRCVKLGVGTSVDRSRLRAETLREALRGAAVCEDRAQRVGMLIQAEDAVARACEKIEATQESALMV
jgi:UDP:flavonoid glycosyltransferase YjiC (YdhE family)